MTVEVEGISAEVEADSGVKDASNKW
jgi:hypothetical protein